MSHEHLAVSGSNRAPLPGAQAIGRVNANAVFDVTLKLRRKKALPALDARPDKAMTRAEVASAYGASQDDIDKVVATLGTFGLKCVGSSPASRTVRVSGPASAMEKAFTVKLFDYAHAGGNYRGRVGVVNTPAPLKDIVTGVFGLDDRRVAHRRKHPHAARARLRHPSSVPASWYTPAQLAEHYKFPAGDGGGQTVGILEFGGGYFESDLKQFCASVGVSMPHVKAVSVDGTSTAVRNGEEGEVMLDVEIVAGVCPKATIVVYFADFTEQGWVAALDAVLQDKENDPGVVSVSWGYAEDALVWTDQAMTEVNESLKEAALMGITVCVASGDDGSSDAVMDGIAHVDFPSSSPYVLSVGGTTVPTKGGPLPDIVWKEGDGLRSDQHGSSGGGVSGFFKRPSWQAGLRVESVNPGAIVGRCIPDLSANADWDASPYLLVVDGQAQPNGGTSAATPLVAALVTLINARPGRSARVGYLTPLLYQPPPGASKTRGELACSDVLKGNNITAKTGGYAAGEGYDAASGWGTPIGTELAKYV